MIFLMQRYLYRGATAIVCCPALTTHSYRPTTARVEAGCVVRAGQCVMLGGSIYVAMALHMDVHTLVISYIGINNLLAGTLSGSLVHAVLV